MKKQVKEKVIHYLQLQKQSYENSLKNKLLNNRFIKKKYKDAVAQIENAIKDITSLIEEVKNSK